MAIASERVVGPRKMTDSFHVRIGNYVPGSPPLDVTVDGYPVLTDVEFREINEHTEHEAAEYTVGVRENGSEKSLVAEPVVFEAGVHYTLLLVGTPDDVSIELLEDGS
jgi:hypothetical protein